MAERPIARLLKSLGRESRGFESHSLRSGAPVPGPEGAASSRLRIGTLGAARITPNALVKPARLVEAAEVVAVSARDPERARGFAARHRIPNVEPTYRDLIDNPGIEALYNPLPNGLHARWTIEALAAGKHVLCEKPFTSNAAEAEDVAQAADAAGKVVMEAFHYRYHPMAARMVEVVRSGELGEVRHVEAWVCFPLPVPGNIRYRFDLAGGATMDAGCYAIHILRTLGGDEPRVLSARARLASAQVDRAMNAEFLFPGGHTGRMTCSLLSSNLLRVAARVVGSSGRMDVSNPLSPQLLGRIVVRTGGQVRRETFKGESTYAHQLRAFVAAVLEGGPVLTAPSDSIANMGVIDDVYEAAGLRRRGA